MAHFNFVISLIATPSWASLLTKTISSPLFIRLVGPPLKLFDPTKYVDSWILRGRQSAIDRNSKERNRDIATNDSLVEIWRFL